jgi:hypothetical protein
VDKDTRIPQDMVGTGGEDSLPSCSYAHLVFFFPGIRSDQGGVRWKY